MAIGIGLAIAGVAIAAVGAGYSIYKGQTAKSEAAQARIDSAKAARISARLEKARAMRAARANIASTVTSLGAAGVSGSLLDTSDISNLSSLAQNLKALNLQAEKGILVAQQNYNNQVAQATAGQIGSVANFGSTLLNAYSKLPAPSTTPNTTTTQTQGSTQPVLPDSGVYITDDLVGGDVGVT